MNVAVVEDEEAVARQLGDYIARYGKEKNISFDVVRFPDGIDFLNGYKPVYDVVLMDIEMPHSNGMRVAHKLRKLDKTVCLVFVTNLAQYAIEGYAVSATDYIVKPVSYEAFAFHFEKALGAVSRGEKKTVSITVSKEIVRIDTDDIYYLEVANHAVVYHTARGVYETWDSLSNAEKNLPAEQFARCNNCFLVNLRNVREVRGDMAVVGGDELKISRNKKKSFLAALTLYV